MDAAKAAWPAWRDVGAKKRAKILRRAAAELRRRVPELCEIETRQTGRPLREYKAQLGRVPEWYEYHASLTETTDDVFFYVVFLFSFIRSHLLPVTLDGFCGAAGA